MVNAAERNQLGTMPNGLCNDAANPLLHHAWCIADARRHNGVSVSVREVCESFESLIAGGLKSLNHP